MSDASFLEKTRDSYDAMAVEYADLLHDEMQRRPLDRALLAAFAERVRAGGSGPVADVGCGPGRVTILLHRLGLDAFGIDLSPAMVALARRTYPRLRFEVGSMLDLELPDASLGGLLAYYSIIHVPWSRRPEVLAEFHRVLAPGGQLMLVFQVGDEILHRDEILGKPVDLHFHRQRPDEVAELLRGAGFDLWATVVKEPEDTEKTPQGILIASKPVEPTGPVSG
ncbi:methyltransferase domain-containing protein [Micromonospora sp. CPCC 206060]|uniref:class I SAM-dependent methyltransferase n=1 Tax=Micromonospora sp. CPCC 206060 TaxID=3122406 RepID=UPI002FF3CD80